MSTPQYPTAPPAAYAPPVATEDPGKTLNIIAIVAAFVFPLVGLICGILGRKKSRAAGFEGKLGLWAIIVAVAIWVLGIVLYATVFASAMSSGGF